MTENKKNSHKLIQKFRDLNNIVKIHVNRIMNWEVMINKIYIVRLHKYHIRINSK